MSIVKISKQCKNKGLWNGLNYTAYFHEDFAKDIDFRNIDNDLISIEYKMNNLCVSVSREKGNKATLSNSNTSYYRLFVKSDQVIKEGSYSIEKSYFKNDIIYYQLKFIGK
jgi:hypothetical protein